MNDIILEAIIEVCPIKNKDRSGTGVDGFDCWYIIGLFGIEEPFPSVSYKESLNFSIEEHNVITKMS